MLIHSALINVMTEAAIKAGRGLLRDFSEVDQLQISRKGTANFVTKSDIRTEKALVKELQKARPDFGYLLEEGGEIPGKDKSMRFVIDPLDGTSNFIHAVPYFCISIGLEKRHADGRSEILAGVIYDPIHNEVFSAEKGKGAFVGNRKLTVSNREKIDEAMLVTGGLRTIEDSAQHSLTKVVSECGATVRVFGATALDLAYLAAGRIDACWYYSLKPWDVAAGMLLVQEAGGHISDMNGEPFTMNSSTMFAANRSLSQPIQKLLHKAA